MSEEYNIILGQKELSNGVIRLHWQMDKDYLPLKPLSSVRIDSSLQLIPVREDWLTGDRRKFEGFTIPYYNYIYMKDMSVMDEAYIVQPFEGDLLVIDIEVDGDLLNQSFTVTHPEEGGEAVVLNPDFNGESSGNIIREFRVVGGMHKGSNVPYTEDEVRSVDLKTGFNPLWKEDLSRVVESFMYATMVNENSIQNAINNGDTSTWGK